MTPFKILETKPGVDNSEKAILLGKKQNISVNLGNARFTLKLADGRFLYLFGEVFYWMNTDGSIQYVDSDSNDFLISIFSESKLNYIIPRLEGQYTGVLVDEERAEVVIFSDRYARCDTFYFSDDKFFCIAADLEVIFQHTQPSYDQKMLAHIFSVYGWYTPKGLTIYQNVKQLRVGEILTLSESGVVSDIIEFKPLEIENYSDLDLERYYTFLKESVVARANRSGITWVSSSSGWDSSILLGLLVEAFGTDKVRMLTGSMQYSEETKVINEFEINKIKKIGEFYGIKPSIVDFDFKNSSAMTYWKKILPFYKSRHIYSYSSFNFSRLSEGFLNHAGAGQTVFNGETSDSFHNFGFSQFVTFFHTQKAFTEYGDKMNCYLYGPSFFKKVLDGGGARDKVFQIFVKMLGTAGSPAGDGSRAAIIQSYLYPLFYGSPRVPFAKTYANPALSEQGQRAIFDFPFREYMPEVLSGLTAQTIYSWIIYLYHSFHSQGSTVNVHKHSMEMYGHSWRSPFNDYRLIELLSKAPEKWGRGLDFNHTKYPLKWVAQNKIKFPYELLDEGPHSYLYDVIEGFSLMAEITYRSAATDFFKETLAAKAYRNILGPEYFDLEYLDKIVDDFLSGKEAKGQDFNNLVTLITLSVTGWF